jgi:hypothetical protein
VKIVFWEEPLARISEWTVRSILNIVSSTAAPQRSLQKRDEVPNFAIARSFYEKLGNGVIWSALWIASEEELTVARRFMRPCSPLYAT